MSNAEASASRPHDIPGRAEYVSGESSYLDGLLPPDALGLPVRSVIEMLTGRYGKYADALFEGRRTPNPTGRPPHATERMLGDDVNRNAPWAARTTSWIRSTRMIGVNVRTVGSFWRVVHYLLTVPGIYDSVHLLPVWEPGVVGSLYGIASWNINPEFLDTELASVLPRFSTPESQLRLLTDIIHLTGRRVGLDVIPHTDRYSQIVLAQPDHFEWLRRRGRRIVDHRADLHEEVMDEIYRFLEAEGPAPGHSVSGHSLSGLPARADLFSQDVSEADRTLVLFGPRDDPDGRGARRQRLISRLHDSGYEPVPATMAPPYRGLRVDPSTSYVDGAGRTWYDYAITRPESMSRVFGPLTRYKLYERKDDNANWEIDFARPRKKVFDYLAGHIGTLQREYGFDFMRGDMSHVQMRPHGVPLEPDEFYDPLAYVKRTVGRDAPAFAYFAETFLSPPGVMAYGDEVDHLEASDAEVTLGNLQSVAVDDPEFLSTLRRYLDVGWTRRVEPSFTVMTADKDDPRFDRFYLDGNEVRLFLSLFLPELPSYLALGFELRDRHERPAQNEFYTKLYVFQESSGPKATEGQYRFGSNTELFERLNRIRRFADAFPLLRESPRTAWALPPDPTAGSRVLAWWLSTDDRRCLCVANADTSSSIRNIRVPRPAPADDEPRVGIKLLLSTHPQACTGVPDASTEARLSSAAVGIGYLCAGEARIYALEESL